MTHMFKALIKEILPPFISNGLRSISRNRNRWTGNYPDWASAVAASSGYDTKVIFNIVRKAAAAVRDGEALWERDSTCYQKEEFNWQLLACLMTVASRTGGVLHVLDFGGALGSTYMQHRRIISGLSECSWNVVENSQIVTCGKMEFQNEVLEFHDGIEQCFAAKPVNVVLFSGVLQYVENPYAVLEQIIKQNPTAIIIDRTPFAKRNERITIQHVPSSIYHANYACRFLDQGRVEALLARFGSLTPWFASPIDPPNFRGVMSLRYA